VYLVITLLQLGLQHLQAVLKAGGLLVGCLQTDPRDLSNAKDDSRKTRKEKAMPFGDCDKAFCGGNPGPGRQQSTH